MSNNKHRTDLGAIDPETLAMEWDDDRIDLDKWPEHAVREALEATFKHIIQRRDIEKDLRKRLGPWTTTFFRWVCDLCPARSDWVRRDFVTDVVEAAQHHHEVPEEAHLHIQAVLQGFEHPVVIERREMLDLTHARAIDNPDEYMVRIAGGGYREAAFLNRDTLTPPTDEELGLEPPKPEQDELIGVPASPGIGSGQAVWVDPNHVDKVVDSALPDNWVLISRYTKPEVVPLMKDANAIVTEVGGMSSHAAHASRELGTPSVVNISVDDLQEYHGQSLRVLGDEGRVEVL